MSAYDERTASNKTIIKGGSVSTGGNWLGVKGTIDVSGNYPSISHSSEDRGKLYYDGEHTDVTDEDIIQIPHEQRITSKKYTLTIYPNKKRTKNYIYYVRFKGTVITPVNTGQLKIHSVKEYNPQMSHFRESSFRFEKPICVL